MKLRCGSPLCISIDFLLQTCLTGRLVSVLLMVSADLFKDIDPGCPPFPQKCLSYNCLHQIFGKMLFIQLSYVFESWLKKLLTNFDGCLVLIK